MGNTFLYSETISKLESMVANGRFVRLSTGWQSLANAGDYLTVHFHTPATGQVIYPFATVHKTGGPVTITLIEGGTYEGGTPITPWRTNRKYRDVACVFSDTKYGLSASGVTISGGVAAPDNGIPGTGVGLTKPGGTSEAGGYLILENDMDYTTKVTAKENNTDVLLLVNFGIGG